MGSRPSWIDHPEQRLICDSQDLQRKVDLMQMADWVNMLAPWEVFATGTFRDRVRFKGDFLRERVFGKSMYGADKAWRKMLSTELNGCSCFYALERNPTRDGYHVHALLADCRETFFKDVWQVWFEKHGRFHSEPVRRYDDVSRYLSKYVLKGPSWWNVKLLPHRFHALHQKPLL